MFTNPKIIGSFIDELITRSEKFVTSTDVWDDYPKDPSYFALAAVLRDVLIPSLKTLKKEREENDTDVF